jgi:DNA invertase Pin-like site-specific DNA recombinase
MPEKKTPSRRLGHAHTGIHGQTLDAQLEQMRKVSCAKNYRENVAGEKADRRELPKLLNAVAPGDIVTLTQIGRLGCSTFDLFAIVKQIVECKSQFQPLVQPWANADATAGRLMIAVLHGLADVERDRIRISTAETGHSRAKAHGENVGRPLMLTPPQQKEARWRWVEEVGFDALTKRYNLSQPTILVP